MFGFGVHVTTVPQVTLCKTLDWKLVIGEFSLIWEEVFMTYVVYCTRNFLDKQRKIIKRIKKTYRSTPLTDNNI